MRETSKMTVKYQFFRMLIIQAAVSGITFAFGAVAFWYFTNIDIAKQILSGVFMIVDFCFLYTASKKLALSDNKSYSSVKPSVLKGALFGVVIAAVNLIFTGIFALLWRSFGDETGIHGVLPTIFNAFYYLWSYPYNGIMSLENGSFTWYSMIFMVTVPIAATLSGYIAGCHKFQITEYFDRFVYEKDE